MAKRKKVAQANGSFTFEVGEMPPRTHTTTTAPAVMELLTAMQKCKGDKGIILPGPWSRNARQGLLQRIKRACVREGIDKHPISVGTKDGGLAVQLVANEA